MAIIQEFVGDDFKSQGSHVPYNVADFSTQVYKPCKSRDHVECSVVFFFFPYMVQMDEECEVIFYLG